jgi:hypothetical protein
VTFVIRAFAQQIMPTLPDRLGCGGNSLVALPDSPDWVARRFGVDCHRSLLNASSGPTQRPRDGQNKATWQRLHPLQDKTDDLSQRRFLEQREASHA